jgi:hypothetical protein
MFLSIETIDGATAIINLAQVTHVTMSDPTYAQEGSVIHFTSDRAIQVKQEVSEVERLLEAARRRARIVPADDGSFLLP